jgi:hypothetical protein
MAGGGELKRWAWQRALRWAALPVTLLVGFLAFRTPEPARTALAVVAGVCSVRSQRERESMVGASVAESLTLELADDDSGASPRRLTRAELLEQLQEFDQWHPHCQLELDVTEVHGVEGAEWLAGELLFSESQAGDLHAEARSVTAHFESVKGQRRLVRVLLGARVRRLPEARP